MSERRARIDGAFIRSMFPMILVSILFAGNLQANEYGVPSANPADNPPVIDPDVESRSTDPDRPPAYGSEDALVLIVIFSDYKCPACRRANPATHQIAAEFPGEVRIEVWQRPLAIHSGADRAAAAALAAQRQGKFWEMHDLIFQNFGQTDVEDLEQHARVLDLDMDQFRADMNDPEIQARIQAENELAEALGARATPGWLINGKVSMGWGSWRGFRRTVETELEASRKLAEGGLSPAEVREHRAIANHTDSATFELYRTSILLPEASVASDTGAQ